MNHRILIVDDQPELRKLVRMTLEFEDYQLDEAQDGASALAAVDRHRPEVVILDVMMPGELSGYDVCARIKSDASAQGTKVILLTARGQQADLARGREAGADHYVVKPFSPLELLDSVATALTERAAAA
jgi:DNA-binding response OmpR family regulator